MSKELARLAERRNHLVAQAAEQRTALAQSLEPWQAPLALADQGIAALRYIRRHPALSTGAALVMVALRPKPTGKWLRRLWLAWQLGRKFLRTK
ncbi:MAG: YqjK-like family protein [Thiobacillaceae bacterium]